MATNVSAALRTTSAAKKTSTIAVAAIPTSAARSSGEKALIGTTSGQAGKKESRPLASTIADTPERRRVALQTVVEPERRDRVLFGRGHARKPDLLAEPRPQFVEPHASVDFVDEGMLDHDAPDPVGPVSPTAYEDRRPGSIG
jgi:hypothetical protein